MCKSTMLGERGLGMNINFIRGFLYGAIFIVIIGLIVGRMKRAKGTIKQRNQTLDKFSDASQPNLTPAKIVLKSTLATIAWFLWFLALIGFIILMAIAVQGELMGG